MIEHGISHSIPPVSMYVSWRARCHAARWGCWWDRDIRQLALDAVERFNATHAPDAESKAELQLVDNFHLGTGYSYIIHKSVDSSTTA